MFRHLKNTNELCLYSGFSCGLAFLVRIEPAFFFPVLILRLAILAYCFYVVAFVEGNKEFAVILTASILVGWLGGYWDYFEIVWSFNQSELMGTISFLIAIAAFCFILFIHWNYGRK